MGRGRGRAWLGGLALWFALLQGAAAAATLAVPVCANAKYKTLLGKPAENFSPLNWTQQDFIDYARNDALKPALPIVVLFALCLLTLVVLLLWRCVRFCCVFCCQQESYGEADKVLYGRKLRIWKGLLLVFAAGAMAVGAWGMYALPRDVAGEAWAVVDETQVFASGLADAVANASRLASGLSAPLDQITRAVASDVDPAGLRANASRLAYFLDHSPSPGQFKGHLVAAEAELRGGLRASLAAVAALLAGPAGPLDQLSGSLSVVAALTGGQIGAMDSGLDAYDAAVRAALLGPGDPPGGAGDPAVTRLSAAQSGLDLALWRSQLDAAVAALAGVRALQGSPAVNPFDRLAAAVGGVATHVETLRGSLMPAVLGDIQAFNGLYYQNASLAARGLLDQAVHINATVVQLPPDALTMVEPLNATLVALDALYDGTPNPLTLAANLSALADRIVLPSDAAALRDKCVAAGDAFDASAPLVDELRDGLANVSAQLASMEPAAAAIGAALAGYASGARPWSDARAALSSGAAAVASAAGAVALADAAAAPAGLELAAVASDIQGLASERAGAADGIGSVISQIDAAPAGGQFVAVLDTANPLYASLGSPPSKALDGIYTLLDAVDGLTAKAGGNVKAQIAQATEPLDAAAAQVRNISARVEEVQVRFTPVAAKYQKVAYAGLMASYGAVMALLLALLLSAWKNCPAGLCAAGSALSALLVAFCLLPLLYTAAMIALRDGCEYAETIAVDALRSGRLGPIELPAGLAAGGGAGGGGAVLAAVEYYLGDPAVQANRTAAEVFKSVVDVAALKSEVNASVSEAIARVRSEYALAPAITSVLDGLPGMLLSLFSAVDGVLSRLDYGEVRPMYERVKGVLCCLVADGVYCQWVATLVFGYLSYLAVICASAVLHKLDGLTDSCCGCVCFDKRDYRPAGPITGLAGRLRDERLGSLGSSDSSYPGPRRGPPGAPGPLL